MENSLGTYIIVGIIALLLCFCVGTCNNSLADKELAKVSSIALLVVMQRKRRFTQHIWELLKKITFQYMKL